MIIAPEVGVAMAMRDYLKAKELLGKIRSEELVVGRRNGGDFVVPQEMTLSHAFYANMGGFGVRFRHRPLDSTGSSQSLPISQEVVRIDLDIPLSKCKD